MLKSAYLDLCLVHVGGEVGDDDFVGCLRVGNCGTGGFGGRGIVRNTGSGSGARSSISKGLRTSTVGAADSTTTTSATGFG